MATRQKQNSVKETILEVVADGTEKVEKVAEELKVQASEKIKDAEEAQDVLQNKAIDLNLTVQDQLKQLRQDILQKLEALKGQFELSQSHYSELRTFIKTEFNTVIHDLADLGKDLKEDIVELSNKHKEHLSETYKRSKQNTLELWDKVVPHKTEPHKPKLVKE